jgi:hypothetical protein
MNTVFLSPGFWSRAGVLPSCFPWGKNFYPTLLQAPGSFSGSQLSGPSPGFSNGKNRDFFNLFVPNKPLDFPLSLREAKFENKITGEVFPGVSFKLHHGAKGHGGKK